MRRALAFMRVRHRAQAPATEAKKRLLGPAFGGILPLKVAGVMLDGPLLAARSTSEFGNGHEKEGQGAAG